MSNLRTLLEYLLKENEAVSYDTFNLSISDLVAHRESLFDAYEHCVYRGKGSKSSGPIIVVELVDEPGKYQLIDGYHRLIEHLLDHGSKSIQVVIGGLGSSEYAIAHGRDRWEGDESKKYGNLEDLTDEENLDDHANKRKILNEAHFGKFNMDVFKRIPGFAKKADYAHKHLQVLGTGSSRTTVALSTNSVLKIAFNGKGLAQNEAEVGVWTNPKTKAIAAKIFDFDSEKYEWVVMEAVQEFNRVARRENIFNTPYNLTIPDILTIVFGERSAREVMRLLNWADFLDNPHQRHIYRTDPAVDAALDKAEIVIEKYCQNPPPYIEALASLVEDNKLELGDIETRHFGKTADGRIVLFDYGLTDDA